MADPTYVITGASGHLGALVVKALITRGTNPDRIIATGRNSERLAALAQTGVQTRHGDMDDPASLRTAFQGGTRLLLVSTFTPGDRVRQHTAAIEAATEAGIERIVYTSATRADTTSMLMAAEHRATEQALAASGVDHVVLRNAFYVENYTGQLAVYAAHGMATAASDGRLSLALRREYAEAAAVVLVEDGHVGRTYELGGPATDLKTVASEISTASDTPIAVHPVDVHQLREILFNAGVPDAEARVFADVDRAIADGELLVPTDDLAQLLGREPLSLPAAVREAFHS